MCEGLLANLDEEEEPAAKPPAMGFGEWQALARKQRVVEVGQLTSMQPGKAVALMDRNSFAGTWREVFVVPVSRHYKGFSEVYDKDGEPLHEPYEGVEHGLQLQSELLGEFGDSEFYKCPPAVPARARTGRDPSSSPIARAQSANNSSAADAAVEAGDANLLASLRRPREAQVVEEQEQPGETRDQEQ